MVIYDLSFILSVFLVLLDLNLNFHLYHWIYMIYQLVVHSQFQKIVKSKRRHMNSALAQLINVLYAKSIFVSATSWCCALIVIVKKYCKFFDFHRHLKLVTNISNFSLTSQTCHQHFKLVTIIFRSSISVINIDLAKKTMQDPFVINFLQFRLHMLVISHYYLDHAACIMLIMEFGSCNYSI